MFAQVFSANFDRLQHGHGARGRGDCGCNRGGERAFPNPIGRVKQPLFNACFGPDRQGNALLDRSAFGVLFACCIGALAVSRVAGRGPHTVMFDRPDLSKSRHFWVSSGLPRRRNLGCIPLEIGPVPTGICVLSGVRMHA